MTNQEGKPTPIPVVLESPYAGHVARNTRYLHACMRDCFARNEYPFASHELYTRALDDTIPEEREQGINAGLAWGAFAGTVVIYTDYGISKGMKAAIEHWKQRGKQFQYRTLVPEGDTLIISYNNTLVVVGNEYYITPWSEDKLNPDKVYTVQTCLGSYITADGTEHLHFEDAEGNITSQPVELINVFPI